MTFSEMLEHFLAFSEHSHAVKMASSHCPLSISLVADESVLVLVGFSGLAGLTLPKA